MRAIEGICLLLLAAPVALTSGCGDAFQHGRHGPAAAVSPHSDWKISGNLSGLEKAADGNAGTAAVGDVRSPNARVEIDLGKACLFNMVIIEHGPEQFGFCRRVAVLTSLDGKQFHRRVVLPGTRHVTILYLGRPVLARHVRLEAVSPGSQAWSVAEVLLR